MLEFQLDEKAMQRIRAELLGMTDKSVKSLQRKMWMKALEPIRTEAQYRAKKRTGLLAANIEIQNETVNWSKSVTGKVVSTKPHSHLVEFGHRIIGHKPNKTNKGKRTKAFPFMRPAFEAKAEDAVSVAVDHLQKALKMK